MASVVYKQRCSAPGMAGTIARNVNHVRYIATRPGAVTNYNEMFGAFGVIDGMKHMGQIDDLHGLLAYVREKSVNKTNMYRTVISLREDDAISLGLTRRTDWETVIERQMEIVAKHMNIPLSRLEWAASVHMEPDHPHSHIMFWDKQQGVKDYFVKPALANAIRKAITKDIFEDEFDALYVLRKDAATDMKSSIYGVLAGLQRAVLDMSEDEIAQYGTRYMSSSSNYSPSGILNARRLGNHTDTTIQMIRSLCQNLPTTGRLTYRFISPELKAQTEALVRHIISDNVQCAAAMASYLKCSRDIASMYGGNPSYLDTMEKNAEKRLMTVLTNAALKAAKGINAIEHEQQDEAKRAAAQRQCLFDMVNAIFTMLSREDNHLHIQPHEKRQEMSRQAQREYALRQKVTGIDWGQDR